MLDNRTCIVAFEKKHGEKKQCFPMIGQSGGELLEKVVEQFNERCFCSMTFCLLRVAKMSK